MHSAQCGCLGGILHVFADLIDDYIVPLVGQSQPVFTGLIRALLTIGGVYLVGILATWIYNRAMVTIDREH